MQAISGSKAQDHSAHSKSKLRPHGWSAASQPASPAAHRQGKLCWPEEWQRLLLLSQEHLRTASRGSYTWTLGTPRGCTGRPHTGCRSILDPGSWQITRAQPRGSTLTSHLALQNPILLILADHKDAPRGSTSTSFPPSPARLVAVRRPSFLEGALLRVALGPCSTCMSPTLLLVQGEVSNASYTTKSHCLRQA